MKKVLMYAGLFLAGVMLADTVKPILSKLPLVGSFFGGKTDK